MRRRPFTGGTIGHLAGIGLGISHQLCNVFCRKTIACNDEIKVFAQLRHRRKILERIVGKLLVGGRIEDQRRQRSEKQRVAIGACLGCDFRADNGIGPRTIIDKHALPEGFRQLVGDRAADNVGRAAGCIRDYQTQRAVGIVLCQRVCRQYCHCAHPQPFSNTLHGTLPGVGVNSSQSLSSQ